MSAILNTDYTYLLKIDTLLKGVQPKYPFQLNEKAKYTQHQLQIYQDNYCHLEKKENAKGGYATESKQNDYTIEVVLI